MFPIASSNNEIGVGGGSGANANDIFTRETRLVTQRAEDRVLLVEQSERAVVFRHFSGIHDDDTVVVHCAKEEMSSR